MVDLHGVRQRHVEIARLQMAHALERQFARHPQRAAFEVPVLGAFGGGADAERRHQLVEEAVEMVRPEHHDEVGIELVQRRRRTDRVRGRTGPARPAAISSMSVVISGLCEQQISWTGMDFLPLHRVFPPRWCFGEHLLDSRPTYREALFIGIARHGGERLAVLRRSGRRTRNRRPSARASRRIRH